MNIHKISAFAAGISTAIFGILYPEYVLLPETYEYIIMDKNCQSESIEEEWDETEQLEKLLWADPEEIEISSCFLELLAEKGIVLWKN